MDARERSVKTREVDVESRELSASAREAKVSSREDAATARESAVADREEIARVKDERERLLGELREMNQQLVITSLRTQEMAEKLERAETELKGANRRKDEFLAMLGHELRNPLAPILTALQLMKLRGDRASVRERDVIERQVGHMVQLIEDLLDVSRITSGKVELHRRNLELSVIVAKAVEIASPLLEKREHSFSATVAERGLVVNADLDRMAQVISNLLTNAAKYTEPRGTITLAAEREDGWIRLTVKDNGLGIRADLLPRIFEMFVQGERTIDRAQGGLGLGLSIARNLVERHGGSVSAYSDGPGRGSEFVVRLPAVDAAAIVEDEETSRRLGKSKQDGPPGMRILVVDDNVDAANGMAECLRCFNHEVATAHDGPDALRIAAEFNPRVVVIDIGLPVMDGYELARRLRDRERKLGVSRRDRLRLVAVTGYGQGTDKRLSAEAGIDVHLVKPVNLDVLTAALVEPMNARERQRAT